VLKHGCLEIHSSDISALSALDGLCNMSKSIAGSTITTRCCVHGDHCNRDIQFVDHSPSQPTITTTASTTYTAPREVSDPIAAESIDWRAGTVITVTLFLLTLLVAATVFLVLFLMLRRRATLHRVHVV
jgi:hypothetical protein